MTEDGAGRTDLLEQLPDALVVVASDGRLVYANTAAERMFGHGRDELVGEHHSVLVPAGFAETLAELCTEGGARHLGDDLTLRGRRRDGSEFPVEIHLGPVRFDGEWRAAASFRDVSHRQRRDSELRDALSLVNATLESTADGILVVSADGSIAGSNSMFACMWRIPTELMESRDDERVMAFVLDQLVDPGAFVAKVHELYDHPGEESNDVLEFRDGRTFERYSRPQRVGDEIVGRVWSFRDVTSRLLAQEHARDALARLSSADARFRSLVESSDDSIVSTTPDGVITSWNAAAERLLGYAREEILGLHLEMLVLPEQRAEASEIQQLAMREGSVRRILETEFLRRDGALVPVSLTVSPIYDADTIVGVSAIIRDVTEARRHQAALVEAQAAAVEASRAKSEFLATMSHEIRTPMNGVIGLTGLLLNTDLDDLQRRYADGVRGAGEALLGIIDDILDFSKLEAGKVDLEEVGFSPGQLVEEVGVLLANSATTKGLLFRTDCAPAVAESVRGDAGRIRQVLINLAGNAIKFTPTGRVDVRVVPAPGHDDASGWLRFEVEDTGIGIDAATQTRLFEPFSQADASTTRRFGGTGLGLAISRRLVDAMGGDLVVVSEPGVGSTFGFELHLPASDDAPDAGDSAMRAVPVRFADATREEPDAPRAATATTGTRRVLVAEDNPVNQMVALGMLTQLGYSAEVVSNGDQALWALRHERFDAVLMDCHMPEMDGFAATRELRVLEAADRRTPVIAMTAGVLDEDRDRCLAAGMDDFVGKPVDVDLLRATLEKWVGGEEPLPVVDEARLDALRALGPADGLGLLPAVVEAFRKAALGELTELGSALAAGDADAFRALVHSLKGAAGNIGAVQVQARCREIEGRIRTSGAVPTHAELERLEAEVKAALRELGRRLDRRA